MTPPVAVAMHKRIQPPASRILAQRTAFYRLLEFLPVPILVSKVIGNDTQGRPIVVTKFLNREFLSVIGYTVAEFRDPETGYRLMFPDPIYRSHIRSRWEEIARTVSSTSCRPASGQVKIRCRDGADRWFSVISDHSGAVCKNHYISIFNDVTHEIETQNQLRQLSETDPLTGLATRRVVLDELRRIANIRAPGATSLILCDIDRFKRINDEFGHEAGDRALESIAHILSSNIRVGDIASRWGGEEFLLLLPNATSEVACEVATRLHQHVNAPDSWHVEFDRPITMTFGIATHEETESYEDTIRRADAALYRGKSAGRNRVVLHHGPTANRGAEATILASLPPAAASLAPMIASVAAL